MESEGEPAIAHSTHLSFGGPIRMLAHSLRSLTLALGLCLSLPLLSFGQTLVARDTAQAPSLEALVEEEQPPLFFDEMAPVPEPTVAAMLVGGALLFALRRKRHVR